MFKTPKVTMFSTLGIRFIMPIRTGIRLMATLSFLLMLASCSKTYTVEGTSTVARIDGKKMVLRTMKMVNGWLSILPMLSTGSFV